jgi:hypothetical protein
MYWPRVVSRGKYLHESKVVVIQFSTGNTIETCGKALARLNWIKLAGGGTVRCTALIGTRLVAEALG